MWPNPQETADLVTFTEEILNEKLHFLCSVTNLNYGNPNSNLRCGNSANNVSNEGMLSFFKNVGNSLCNTSGRFGGGGICIKLFGMFLKTDGGSLGLDFPFIFKTGKPGGICLTQTTVFGYLVCCPLEWLLSIFVVLLDLMLVGTRLHFSVLRDNWIYSQLHNTF